MYQLEIFEAINKTREYLDYIEEHVVNVQSAWEELEEKCKDMKFVSDSSLNYAIDKAIQNHDLSRMSEQEFIQCRKAFCPTHTERGKFESAFAWEHHKDNNSHHWENWTKHSDNWVVDCVHMVCEWMAIGYKFGDDPNFPQSYYEKNKDKIDLPANAVSLMYEIFERI